jgi:hypothetical protein
MHILRNSIPLLLLAFLVGCGTGTNLQPAPSATEVAAMEDAAISSVDGIDVRAQADAWTGDLAVTTHVTPVRVYIENDSGEPLRVRYSEFALVAPDGQRYAALPPFNVEGDITEPVLVRDYSPVADPIFTYDAFSVAPYYSTIYPDLTPYADPFFYDPDYYYRYGDVLDTIFVEENLPTATMLQNALPEGVLYDGGQVSGFLYFEKVDPEQPRVTFRADLEKADAKASFGTATIPFTVEN